jgi:tRNA1(Val) A37 N6-methylase TrmN6
MEYLHNGFTIDFSPGAFPLSTDSIALSGFVKLPKNAAVLDLGSGCGTLGLLLCAKDDRCTVTGIELDEAAHAMASLHTDNGPALALNGDATVEELLVYPMSGIWK